MDSVPKIVTCLRNTARDLGIPVPTEQQAKDVIGLSLAKATEVLFPAHLHLSDELVAGYKAQYRELDVTPTPLFKDVESVLKQLSDADGNWLWLPVKDVKVFWANESGLVSTFECKMFR